MKPKADACIFCGNPATLLCDGHIGYPPAAPNCPHEYDGLDLMRPYTCDAPMCHDCAATSGRYFACRRGKGCQSDTIDYCPGCAVRHDVEIKSPPIRRRIEDEKHANVTRLGWWAKNAPPKFLGNIIEGGGQISLF